MDRLITPLPYSAMHGLEIGNKQVQQFDCLLSSELVMGLTLLGKDNALTPDKVLLLSWAVYLSRICRGDRVSITNYSPDQECGCFTWEALPLSSSFLNLISIMPESDYRTQSNIGFSFCNTHSLNPQWDRQDDFELTIEIISDLDSFSISSRFQSQQIEPIAASRCLRNFIAFLSSIVKSPTDPIGTLSLIAEAEKNFLLETCNATATHYPEDAFIHQSIEYQAEKTPNATAVMFGNSAITYRELNIRANGLAIVLQKQGVIPDSIVGVFADRSIETIIALLAVLKAGGAYLPLDPEYPSSRLKYMIEQTSPRLILSQKHLLSLIPSQEVDVLCIDDPGTPLISHHKAPKTKLTGAHLAYVIFTSGSTGNPKGVMIPHRGISNRLLWMQEAYCLKEGEGVIHKTPISFDVSVWELFWPLMVGGRLVLAKPGGHRDTQYLTEIIKEADITTIHFVPSMLHAFLEEEGCGYCTSLKRVICSGEALSLELQKKFFDRYCRVELHNLYGPTEASVDVSAWECRSNDDLLVVPIGRPIANTQLYVLNEYLAVQPIDVAGELYIGGRGLARGYYNQPNITEERFVANPFSNNKSAYLYKTGDLAVIRDTGLIEYLGRLDDQVKIRGFRIELLEIESALNRHPAVLESVVVAVEHSKNLSLVGYVHIKDGEHLIENELKNHLSELLPSYMIPAAFVPITSIPVTPNGKADRKFLKERGWPKKDQSAYRDKSCRSELENNLAEIWCQVLDLSFVDVNDNFFELGGTSIHATMIVSRVRSQLNAHIPLTAILEYPTITLLREQMGLVNSNPTITHFISEKENASQEQIPLSPAQQSLWLLTQIEPNNIAYNIPFALRLKGKFTKEQVVDALTCIISRHESLRSGFFFKERQPFSHVMQSTDISMHYQEIDGSSESAKVVWAIEFIRDKSKILFDLESPPLARFYLLKLHEEDYILGMTVHHLIFDAWSWMIFTDELRALLNHQQLQPIDSSYRHFAEWQELFSKSSQFAQQLNYWKNHLTPIPKELVIERSSSEPLNEIISVTFLIRKDLTKAITKLARSRNMTLFMVLMTIFKILIFKLSNTEDILISCPVNNRERKEFENLIGFFVNLLLIRTKISPTDTTEELLLRIRKTVVKAFNNQEVPFDIIVAELNPPRNGGQNSFLQTHFVLRNGPLARGTSQAISATSIVLDELDAKYDLKLDATECPDGLTCKLIARGSRFSLDVLEIIKNNFPLISQQIVEEPSKKIEDLLFDFSG